jgi:hypothetical protein
VSCALTTFLAMKNLDPAFLKTFLISVLFSSNFHRFVQSSTSTFFSHSSTAYSSFWLAIITDPKIVRSCVSTAASSPHVLEKNVHYSVPNSDMYLQAYVRDDFFLHRLCDILEKMDSKFCAQIEIRKDEREIELEKGKRNDDRSEIDFSGNISPINLENDNENEKWMKELKSWSFL